MKTLMREPLFYFLLLGGLLFGVYEFIGDNSRNKPQLDEIVITDGQIEALIQGFERVRQRLPSRQELDGLLQDFVREEIMVREALAMGLDRDDPIVRRRLQQKLEFLSEDIATLDEPTDTELQTFLVDNSDLFRQPTRFTLQHIYFNSNERGESVLADTEALLDSLRQEEKNSASLATVNSPAQIGDALLMTPSRFEMANGREISRAMGTPFLEAIKQLPVGSWAGPVESGFGLHLVYVSKRIEGDMPPLAKIRNSVQREWEAVNRQQANDAFYSAMRERYTITLADPESARISTSRQDAMP